MTSPKCPSCRDCPAFERSAFARLSETEIDRLDGMKRPLVAKRGETFNVTGQPVDAVYCMSEGSAKVTLEESIVKLVGPGDMLGYRCIFSEEAFRATASALTETRVCRISKHHVFELIGHTPTLAFEFLKRMGNEVAATERQHHSFVQKNVRERLAEDLLILKRKFGVEEGGAWKIDTRLTRAELSNWVGASRETVIRTLTEFTQEGLLEMRGDFLYLLDPDRLATVGRVTPTSVVFPAI